MAAPSQAISQVPATEGAPGSLEEVKKTLPKEACEGQPSAPTLQLPSHGAAALPHTRDCFTMLTKGNVRL